MNIVDQVGRLIAKQQGDKRAKYLACGCQDCLKRAKDVGKWLEETPNTAGGDKEKMPACEKSNMSSRQRWLCHSCLRRIDGAKSTCIYCGKSKGG